MNMSFEEFVIIRVILAALAAHRATWMLISEDGPGWVFRRFRDWLFKRYDETTWVNQGFSCPNCVSFWLAGLFLILPFEASAFFAAAAIARIIFRWELEE